jgi:hypothetical protein
MDAKSLLELRSIAGNVIGRNDEDVRPGDMMGLDVEQVRNFIKRQKKCQGEEYELSMGRNEDLSVRLPGTARVLLGFAFFITKIGEAAEPDGHVTLEINNEVIVRNVFVEFFGPDFTDEEYYFIPRPLSGKDDIKFVVDGVVDVYTLNVIYYYL